MKRLLLPLPAAMEEELQKSLLKKLSFDNWDDMYAAIGYGGLTAVKAVGRIRDDVNKAVKADKTSQNPLRTTPDSETIKRNRHAVNGVIVEDIDSCMIKFSKCCWRCHRGLYYQGLRRVHPPGGLPQHSRHYRSQAICPLGTGALG